MIFDGRAVGIIDGSSEFEGRAEGVIAGSSEFEGRAEGVISADVVGLAEVGRTVGDVGFRVDGLPDVGLDVEGLFDGLAEVGLFVGLAVAGILMRRDIELLGHAILFDSKMVPGSRSTNLEISNTPELFTTIKCRVSRIAS